MSDRCGFTWVSPMRQIWVRCTHTTAPHNRHENEKSFVAVGYEEACWFPHRWVDADTADIVATFLDKLRNDERMYILNDHGEVCLDGWVTVNNLERILNELVAEEKGKR